MKIDIEQFYHRVIQDAVTSAMAETWRYRAEQLEAARPKPGDYVGAASSDDLAVRDRRLAEQARAARNHSTICEFQDFDDVLADVLAESTDPDRMAA